ncbi:putative RmlC-like cupin family protein [Micromonospora olivasterospora]|uniref:Putative RmlC-like cupin family protein n=2 Tax=Micromonospora olivasterospora TaxID=1880 RepID=A0A562IJQ7_MICOL|nr:putative RmlC-like cupin family protein [Micromonospora olivasterospora]
MLAPTNTSNGIDYHAGSKKIAVHSAKNGDGLASPQGQMLIPTVSQQLCGTHGISACTVVMQPGKVSRLHLHARTEIVVVCVEGWAATLIGPNFEPVLHGPGEFLYVPEGVIHAAVNLSMEHCLVAYEFRTDPKLNEDVVLVPEQEEAMLEAAAKLQDGFAEGRLKLPTHWDLTEPSNLSTDTHHSPRNALRAIAHISGGALTSG